MHEVTVVGAYFEVRDDGHGCIHVVEGAEEDVGRSAVHELQRVAQLAEQVKCLFGEVNPDVAGVASMRHEVAHGVETDFLVAQLVHVAHTEQRFKVGEGDCWWRGG